jgi:predicted Zn-dependent peptidase
MYKIQKLHNGITLITVPVAGTMATTVLAMFPVGSRYEAPRVSGASHFLEHMLFKGTEKHPEAIDISRVLEAAGAEYNAYTNKDYTGYYVKIKSDEQNLAFEMLSDMIYNSKIEEAEVEKEKGAVVEELRMYKDNPTMAVDMLFEATMFGGDEHALGRDIGGTEKTVRGMSRADLWNYYREHYGPKNMVLVVAGKLDSKLKKYLQNFSSQKAPGRTHPASFYKTNFEKFAFPAKAPALSHRVVVEERVADQAHVILGFPGLPNNHKDKFAATLLLNILGSGMSSRLFVEVREKRGLAYMVSAGAANYRDTGAVYVQAGLDPARLKEALAVILAECERLADEPVTSEELKNAKSAISGGLALGLENSRVQAEWYAKQFLFNTKIETPDYALAKLNKVTVAQVQAVAKNLFKRSELRLALIGKVKKDDVLSYLT